MRKYGVFLLFCVPAYSYHILDIVGGTGTVSANVTQQSYLAGSGTAKAETGDSVPMRQSLFMGARYSNYVPFQSWAFFYGGELSGLMTKPSVSGKWNFKQFDTNAGLTGEAAQDFTAGSAPGLNIFGMAFHLGFSMPLNAFIAPELGALVGAGFGDVKYTYQSPVAPSFNGGASDGSSGLGLHVGLRAAVRFFPAEAVSVGVEYRFMAEAMGSVFSFAPGLQSNSSSATLTAHLLLLTVGYRFGMEPTQSKS